MKNACEIENNILNFDDLIEEGTKVLWYILFIKKFFFKLKDSDNNEILIGNGDVKSLCFE